MCRAEGGTVPAGGWGAGAVSPPRHFLISSIFKRHSEAYAQSICIHNLTTFV